ncbi:MAG: hypothetical protein JWM19_1473 [Actinomycetia bacterium]|nr:hypothetical protein [Actinomycetes bacterium]
MRRPRGTSALAMLVTITATCLLAGCTSNGGGTVTTPVATGPAGSAPTGSAPTGSAPTGSASSGSAAGSGAPSSGVSASAGSGSTGSGSTAPAGHAASIAAAALASLEGGRAVHIDITSGDKSNGTTSYSEDATPTGGQQIITIDGTQHATILFIDNVGYLKANAAALAGFIGAPAAQAPTLAGKWLSFSPGDTLGTTTYASLVAGITLSSVASEIKLSGPDTVTGPQTVNGQSVLAISSPVPTSQQLPSSARMILYVTASGSRPVTEKLSGVAGAENEYSFSHWGESLHLTVPADALPVSSLGAPILA